MRKVFRKVLLAALILGSSALPYVGLNTAQALPKGHCTTCAHYVWDLCWIVIADSDC
jgi:hypothetical protein